MFFMSLCKEMKKKKKISISLELNMIMLRYPETRILLRIETEIKQIKMKIAQIKKTNKNRLKK